MDLPASLDKEWAEIFHQRHLGRVLRLRYALDLT
jgi:hypothetical protein